MKPNKVAEFVERRKYSRKRFLWHATVTQGRTEYPCVILDYSLGGAKICLPEAQPLELGPITISCAQLGDVTGTVVWQNGRRLGIKLA
ncbi:MAG TPA: PilZ domain-containing protein [Alphaproteobacteria bacterium]|jgi:hypothetical protein